MRCASTWRRRWRWRRPACSFHELGEGRLRCDPAQFGDVVLARKEAPASYHLCVTHDDALQGVTLVTRGVDLKPATHLHRLLQALLGWPEPAYAHHPLLLGPDGKRLAKRDRAPTPAGAARGGAQPGRGAGDGGVAGTVARGTDGSDAGDPLRAAVRRGRPLPPLWRVHA